MKKLLVALAILALVAVPNPARAQADPCDAVFNAPDTPVQLAGIFAAFRQDPCDPVVSVPEPAGLLLMLTGVAAIAGVTVWRRRRESVS